MSLRMPSYWLAEPDSPSPPLKRHLHADVTIIGGGFSGVSAAYHLKNVFPEKEIVLLDKDVLGFGASGRNLGNLNPNGWNNTGNPCPNRYTVLESLIREHSISCEYSKGGCYLLAADPKQLRELEGNSHELMKAGGSRLLDQGALGNVLRTERFVGALFDPHWGTIHPVRYRRGMKRVLESLGVKIYERTAVQRIRPGPEVELQTEDGSVKSGKAVLATGGYTASMGYFRNRIVPGHTGADITEALSPGEIEALGLGGGKTFVDMDMLFGSFHATSDNRIIAGGKNGRYFYGNGLKSKGSYEPFDHTLHQYIRRVFPQLAGIGVDYSWSGFDGTARDRIPSFGSLASHRNLSYVYGNGMSVATTMGKALADYTVGADLDEVLKPFLNRRLPLYPPEPLRYLALNGALWYLRRRVKG